MRKNDYSMEYYLKNSSILDYMSELEYCINIYNKLDSLDLKSDTSINVSTNIYRFEYVELLIDQYIKNNSHEIENILYKQKELIYEYLMEEKEKVYQLIVLLNKYLSIVENSDDLLYNGLADDNFDEIELLEELISNLRSVLKKSFNIKRKNIKVKILNRKE